MTTNKTFHRGMKVSMLDPQNRNRPVLVQRTSTPSPSQVRFAYRKIGKAARTAEIIKYFNIEVRSMPDIRFDTLQAGWSKELAKLSIEGFFDPVVDHVYYVGGSRYEWFGRVPDNDEILLPIRRKGRVKSVTVSSLYPNSHHSLTRTQALEHPEWLAPWVAARLGVEIPTPTPAVTPTAVTPEQYSDPELWKADHPNGEQPELPLADDLPPPPDPGWLDRELAAEAHPGFIVVDIAITKGPHPVLVVKTPDGETALYARV